MNRNTLLPTFGGCGTTLMILFSWTGLCAALFICAGLATVVWRDSVVEEQTIRSSAVITDVWYTQAGIGSPALNVLYHYSVNDQKYYHVDVLSPGVDPAQFTVGTTVTITMMPNAPDSVRIVEPTLNNNRYRTLNYGLAAGIGIFSLLAAFESWRRATQRRR